MDYFSIMPVEIFMDDRLSKTDLRVLGSIMSWRNKTTNLCHPSRDQISERCGLSVSKISISTTRLVKHGWLEKTGNGGRSMRCQYKFKIPNLYMSKTVPDSGTVPELDTVPDSGTKTVPDSGTKTVPELGRGKKLKDNLKETKNNTKLVMNLFYDVSDQVKLDFIKLRKDKKASITETAVNGLRREAEKANISLEIALIECCQRGWVGFKADWYLKNNNAVHKSEYNLNEYNKQQTDLAYEELFGDKKQNIKDISDETRRI